jgi:hypothetical protein
MYVTSACSYWGLYSPHIIERGLCHFCCSHWELYSPHIIERSLYFFGTSYVSLCFFSMSYMSLYCFSMSYVLLHFKFQICKQITDPSTAPPSSLSHAPSRLEHVLCGLYCPAFFASSSSYSIHFILCLFIDIIVASQAKCINISRNKKYINVKIFELVDKIRIQGVLCQHQVI